MNVGGLCQSTKRTSYHRQNLSTPLSCYHHDLDLTYSILYSNPTKGLTTEFTHPLKQRDCFGTGFGNVSLKYQFISAFQLWLPIF